MTIKLIILITLLYLKETEMFKNIFLFTYMLLYLHTKRSVL